MLYASLGLTSWLSFSIRLFGSITAPDSSGRNCANESSGFPLCFHCEHRQHNEFEKSFKQFMNLNFVIHWKMCCQSSGKLLILYAIDIGDVVIWFVKLFSLFFTNFEWNFEFTLWFWNCKKLYNVWSLTSSLYFTQIVFILLDII